ncbi:MAG: ribonuclease PH [Chloroflexi bacterium]|nr:ribonuclease PH [Chloroflexota bacterium]
MKRFDGRSNDELRPVKITPGYLSFPVGSALIEMGQTRVLCAVTLEDRVPAFLKGSGSGWVTAEYSMLPASTATRTQRESMAGRPSGRTQEIQRLIGRSLRAVTDLSALGEMSLTVDCDALQADGGTRTASITGAYVALHHALRTLLEKGAIRAFPLRTEVAATSVGIVEGELLLDLNYDEDCTAEVDFNVVMTGEGKFVEVQGTAEHNPFTRTDVDSILDLAGSGVRQLVEMQRVACGL